MFTEHSLSVSICYDQYLFASDLPYHQDWETGIFDALKPMLQQAKCSWERKEVMTAFGSVETDILAQHPDMPYDQLLAVVHSTFAKRLGTTTAPEEDVAFAASLNSWPVFPDSPAALAALKKHYKLMVLSNVDNRSFNNFSRPALESAGGAFDAVLTAQDIGSYKPNPANLNAALAMLEKDFGIPKEKVLVVANSLFHDHGPANALGVSSAWIARKGGVMGIGGPATYDFKFDTLGELSDAREKTS